MEDRAILDCISAFVAEEHRLRDLQERGAVSPDVQSARLAELERGLDHMWALLRQRREMRAAGLDPDLAPDSSLLPDVAAG